MNVKVCKKCNLQYHDNIRFCGKCGSELETIVITENHNRNNIWEQLQIHKKFIGILLIIIILLIIGYYNYSSKMATDKLGPGSIYAAVKVDGKWGFIDQHGRYYIKPYYDALEDFSEGIAAAKDPKNGKWGFINTEGKYVIKPQFDGLIIGNMLKMGRTAVARKFSNKRALVRENDLYGFIDMKGNLVIKPQYTDATYFSDGLSNVQINANYGVINEQGNYVVSPTQVFSPESSEGLIVVTDNNMQYGYVNKTGKYVIKPQYDYATEFAEGLAQVNLDNKIAFIDQHGVIVFYVSNVPNAQHTSVSNFHNGVAIIHASDDKINGTGYSKYGAIDNNGKIIIDVKFDKINYSGWNEGLAAAKDNTIDDRHYGYIDLTGQFVINPQFLVANSFHDGIAKVKMDNNKWGFIDKTGKFILEAKYNDIRSFSCGMGVVAKDGRYGFINTKGKFIIEPKYENANSFAKFE